MGRDKIMKLNLSAWITTPSEGLSRSSKPIHIQKDDGLELEHKKFQILRYFRVIGETSNTLSQCNEQQSAPIFH